MRSDRQKMIRTQERIFPPGRRPEDGHLAEHRVRYRFVADHGSGRILDVGCGTGYGCQEIARRSSVREVAGIDVSESAISTARRYYPDPKVLYRERDLLVAGWENGLGRFDTVVALEILEHLRSEEAFWRGIERALLPGGTLWLSTPLGRGRGKPVSDPYHVHQLRRPEVEALFARGWNAQFYGQTGSWIEPWTPGRRYYTILVRAHPKL